MAPLMDFMKSDGRIAVGWAKVLGCMSHFGLSWACILCLALITSICRFRRRRREGTIQGEPRQGYLSINAVEHASSSSTFLTSCQALASHHRLFHTLHQFPKKPRMH